MSNYDNSLGMNRTELKRFLGGEPTKIAILTRRQKEPIIYSYGEIEFHFTNAYSSGTVCLVFDNSNHRTIAKS